MKTRIPTQPVVINEIIQTPAAIVFEAEINTTKGSYLVKGEARDGAIFARKLTDTKAEMVRICDFRVPMRDKSLLPALQAAATKYLSPAADSAEAVYFRAAREIEMIAEAYPFKSMSEDEVWHQKGETVGAPYELVITEDGQPGIAESKGLWHHVKAIVARTSRLQPGLGVKAVADEGLAQIQLVLMDAAKTAQQFSSQQHALFA